jgi:alanyl aminopeptidase
VRAIAILVVLAGCGPSEMASAARAHGQAAGRAPVVGPAEPVVPAPPELRLAAGVAPTSYDLTLELDPTRDSFTGHVTITVAVAAPGTTQLWLHAVDLEFSRVAVIIGGHAEPVAMLAGGERSQTRGLALPRPVGAPGGETIALVIDYAGHVTDLTRPTGEDEQGLFRERARGRWYLYSQSESIFARRFVPCFDEPRWKPAWRVTAIVPRDLVALGNAPIAGERALPDGRREVRFAEIAGLPSYLLAIAVGPFDIVEVGKLGRARIPVRLAVAKGDRARAGLAIRMIPKVLDTLEAYLDAPLPSAKLDLVAVPDFFGAMENVGLITFDAAVLVGGRELVPVAAHEIAHQWFGNLVTPAWWEELWLSEAFATWMEGRVVESLRATSSPVGTRIGRARALSADDPIDAEPLVHPIDGSDEIEPAFSEIAYRKGAAVLADFERFVGADRFREAVRGYLAANAGASVTSQAFLDALASATSPEVAAALGSNLSHAGTPVVDLAVRCGTPARVVASARDGVAIPICVRYPVFASAGEQVCLLAGAHVEQPLPAKAGCPVWLVGNAGGRGYYQTAWGTALQPPLALLSPEERLARGDDAAAAVRRGELPIASALAELTALATTRDPFGELAAVAIARAIDPLITDPARPAWAAWLAKWFPDHLTRAALSAPRPAVSDTLRMQIVALTRPALDPAAVAAARAAIDRTPGGLGGSNAGVYDPVLLRIATGRDPDPLFARLVRLATTSSLDELRTVALGGLGEFPAAYASRILDIALDRRFAAAQVSPALATMLLRTETRTAAWQALHARLGALLDALPASRARDLIAATSALCDAGARAEVAADFTPRFAAIPDGKRTLARALASIDRCISRRAAAGDIAAALSAAPVPVRRP